MPPASPSLIRCFIAIEFSPALRRYLGSVSQKLANAAPERAVSWVKSDSIHLTLKFLGDTPHNIIVKLIESLTHVAAHLAPFALTTTQLGCFPNLRQPRVIWVGLDRDSASHLIELQKAVEAATVPLGFPTEARPFSPHITLGRVRRDVSPAGAARVGEAVKSAGRIEPASDSIQAVILMKSDLQRGGPIYTPLHKATLTGQD